MKNLMKKLIGLGLVASPLSAFATNDNLFSLIVTAQDIIGRIVPFIIGLAVLVIVWGLFNYISGAGDEEKRAQAKLYIIWGIIGLFVMVSIWGLVGIVSRTANLGSFSAPTPQVVPCPRAGQTWSPDTNGVWGCR